MQWPKRSNKWPWGNQEEAIPPSSSATVEDEEEEQPYKPKRNMGPRSKSCGRKPESISSLDRVREPDQMPPIYEDDFEDIGGYPIEEPRQSTKGVE